MVSAVEWKSLLMNAIFFFCSGVMNFFWSFWSSSSSCLSRQAVVRSLVWSRACFEPEGVFFVFEFEGFESSSSSSSNFVVGVWKGIERKRMDSTWAEGTNDRICR